MIVAWPPSPQKGEVTIHWKARLRSLRVKIRVIPITEHEQDSDRKALFSQPEFAIECSGVEAFKGTRVDPQLFCSHQAHTKCDISLLSQPVRQVFHVVALQVDPQPHCGIPLIG